MDRSDGKNKCLSLSSLPLFSYAVLEEPNLSSRKTMEDFTISEHSLTSDGRWSLFCVLDGWGVMERMRQDKRWNAIPILILSAYGFEWESELTGAQGYIPKSVGMDEILERIRKSAGPPPLHH